jgi:archaellum component FlaF (FlaF/FlaG flagellin family)
MRRHHILSSNFRGLILQASAAALILAYAVLQTFYAPASTGACFTSSVEKVSAVEHFVRLDVNGSMCFNILKLSVLNEGNVAVEKVEVYCEPSLSIEDPSRNIIILPGERVFLEFKVSDVKKIPYTVYIVAVGEGGGQSMAALTGMYPENCTGEH